MTKSAIGRTALWALAVVTVGITASCAPTDPPEAAVTASATPDDGRVMPSSYANLANSNLVDKSADLGEHASLPWAVLVDDPDFATVYVAYADPANCGAHLGLDVTETSTSVTIAAVSDSSANDVACTRDFSISGGSYDLKAALGDRVLLHAPLSSAWAELDNPLGTVAPPAAVQGTTARPYDGTATCENLLDAGTVASLAKSGIADLSDQAQESMASQPNLAPYAFLDRSGLACVWGVQGNDLSTIYAYGPISDADAQAETDSLRADGYEEQIEAGVAYWHSPTDDLPIEHYAFGNGFWAYQFDNGSGPLLDQIVENAPSF